VILGAGFDARGSRMRELTEHAVSVFEVDTPEQIARKLDLLSRASKRAPAHVRYVPFDFHMGDAALELPEALARQGFRAGAGTLFVLEGVIGYLDDRAVDQCFGMMATIGGPRGRVAFTYGEASF
jgi:methyltransferase (TIGR00027 family)